MVFPNSASRNIPLIKDFRQAHREKRDHSEDSTRTGQKYFDNPVSTAIKNLEKSNSVDPDIKT